MEVIGVLPKLRAQFRLSRAELQRLENGRNHHRRQRTRINVRVRVETQILQRLSGTGNKAPERAERLRECAANERYALFYPKLLSRSTAMLTARHHEVRFITEDADAVRLCHSD